MSERGWGLLALCPVTDRHNRETRATVPGDLGSGHVVATLPGAQGRAVCAKSGASGTGFTGGAHEEEGKVQARGHSTQGARHLRTTPHPLQPGCVPRSLRPQLRRSPLSVYTMPRFTHATAKFLRRML